MNSFRQCPLLFKHRHLERLPDAPTPETTHGILIHETLAEMFKLNPDERSLDRAQELFRELWRRQRRSSRYAPLFNLELPAPGEADAPRDFIDVERERAWGLKSFETLRSYFQVEDPSALSPLGCEEKMASEIRGVADADAAIPITGVVDRLDELTDEEGIVVVDYKTGRAPAPRFRDNIFFQLEMYGLLLRETGRRRGKTVLRLMYLGDGGEVVEKEVSDADLEATADELRTIYAKMLDAFRNDHFPCTCSRCSPPPSEGTGGAAS